jgi:hypothetical protein
MPVCTVHRARIGSFVTSGVFDRWISQLNLLYETPALISKCFGVVKDSKKVVVLKNQVVQRIRTSSTTDESLCFDFRPKTTTNEQTQIYGDTNAKGPQASLEGYQNFKRGKDSHTRPENNLKLQSNAAMP